MRQCRLAQYKQKHHRSVLPSTSTVADAVQTVLVCARLEVNHQWRHNSPQDRSPVLLAAYGHHCQGIHPECEANRCRLHYTIAKHQSCAERPPAANRSDAQPAFELCRTALSQHMPCGSATAPHAQNRSSKSTTNIPLQHHDQVTIVCCAHHTQSF